MEKLTKEIVEHVADLARLYVDEKEIDKYGEQLYAILSEIDKIKAIDTTASDIMISPFEDINRYRTDVVGSMLKKDDIFKNAKNTSWDYVMVVKSFE